MKAYLLIENEEYTDPKVIGVTMDKAIAEAWQAEKPVSYLSVKWHSYMVIPVIGKRHNKQSNL